MGLFFFPFFRGFYVETGYVLWDWPEQSTIVRLKKNRQTSPTYRTEKIAWVWLKKYTLIFFLLTCDIIFKKKSVLENILLETIFCLKHSREIPAAFNNLGGEIHIWR